MKPTRFGRVGTVGGGLLPCLLSLLAAANGPEPVEVSQATVVALTGSSNLWMAFPFGTLGWGGGTGVGLSPAATNYNFGQIVSSPAVLRAGSSVSGTNEAPPTRWMVNAISPEAAADQIRLTAYTVGMAVGEKHTLLLKRDGTVMAAGWNQSGQTEVPDRLVDVVAVAAGSDHSLALRADGRVVAWGWNQAHQTEVPADLEEVVAIAAGREFSLALQKNGAVRAWGGVLPGADGNANEGGAYEPPEELETPPWPLKPGFSPVVAITAGWRHALALRQDGTVLGWGLRSERAAYTPPTNLGPVVAISAGKGFSLALKPDGTVRAWGSNGYHQLDVPPTACHVVAIASGSYHACALREDGTVVVWGDNSVGQTTVPSGLRNVAAIAAGGFGCEVLIQMQPRMAGVRVVNGRFYCDLNLPAGQPYRIEGSLDLIHWETVDLDVARPGWLEWQSMSRSQGGVFYRLAPLGFRFDDGPMKVGWPNAVSRFPLR